MTTIGRLPTTRCHRQPRRLGPSRLRVRDGDAYVVEDLQSTNGTFVNEKRVSRHVLQTADVLLSASTCSFQRAPREEPVADDHDAESRTSRHRSPRYVAAQSVCWPSWASETLPKNAADAPKVGKVAAAPARVGCCG